MAPDTHDGRMSEEELALQRLANVCKVWDEQVDALGLHLRVREEAQDALATVRAALQAKDAQLTALMGAPDPEPCVKPNCLSDPQWATYDRVKAAWRERNRIRTTIREGGKV